MKELRELIQKNNNCLDFGGLKFELSGDDIDVYLCDELVGWFDADHEYSELNEIREVFKNKNQENKELKEFKNKNKVIEEQVRNYDKFIGMVEAYEKLLIGRSVNLGDGKNG